MWRGVILMAFINRLPELISDRHGRFSTTAATTLVSLLVSSVVLSIIAWRWEREVVEAFALYLGAWVTHASIQSYRRGKADSALPDTPLQGGKPDGRGAD